MLRSTRRVAYALGQNKNPHLVHAALLNLLKYINTFQHCICCTAFTQLSGAILAGDGRTCAIVASKVTHSAQRIKFEIRANRVYIMLYAIRFYMRYRNKVSFIIFICATLQVKFNLINCVHAQCCL